MATSLRNVAASCLGIRGAFSLGKDFFGYRGVRPGAVSLRRQLELLSRPHIHLDVIVVGPGFFSTQERNRIDHAIFGAREIFEAIPLGIGRITIHEIPDDDASDYATISKKRRAKQLTRKFRGSNDDAMDVFFVTEYSVMKGGDEAVGICNVAGCNKDLYVFNGCVLGVQLGNIRIRRLLAHELGHGLRLIHHDSDDNLMQQGGLGRELTERQKRRMLRDCFVQEGCEDA